MNIEYEATFPNVFCNYVVKHGDWLTTLNK